MSRISGLVFAMLCFCTAHFAQSEKCVEGTSKVCTPFTYKDVEYDDCIEGAFNTWCLLPGQTGAGWSYSYCGPCLEATTTTAAPFRPRPFTSEATTTTIPTTTTTTTIPTTTTTTTTIPITTTTTPTTTTKTTTTTTIPTITTTPTTTTTIPPTTTTIPTTTTTIPTTTTISTTTTTTTTTAPTTTTTKAEVTSESDDDDDDDDDVTASGDAYVTTSDDEDETVAASTPEVVTSSSSSSEDEEKSYDGFNKTGKSSSKNSNILVITIVACSVFLATGILITVFIFRRRFRRQDSYETDKNQDREKEAAIPLAEYRHKGVTDSAAANEQNRISSADGDKANDGDDDESKPALA